jgi:hypothetical protein
VHVLLPSSCLQVRCVDKSTGDMMVRYTMAAQSALDLLRQLLLTCRAYAAGPAGEVEAGGESCCCGRQACAVVGLGFWQQQQQSQAGYDVCMHSLVDCLQWLRLGLTLLLGAVLL